MKKIISKKIFVFLLFTLIAPLMGFTKVSAKQPQSEGIILKPEQLNHSHNLSKMLTKYDSVFLVNENISESKIIKKEVFKNEYDGQKTEKVRINIVQLAEYYFLQDGKVKKGKIFGNSNIAYNDLNTKINEIKYSIKNNRMNAGRNNKINALNYGENINGSKTNLSNRDWKEQDEWKNYYILNYDGIHYADYSEWITTYQLRDYNGNNYYSVVYESYIKPDGYKTDFRTNYLIYKFDPTYGSKALLRDYGPKVKNPRETITFSVGAGIQLEKNVSAGSNGISAGASAGFSASISKSWSTLVESPEIYDNGNMGKNYAEIKFNYLNPYKDSGQYYVYNISQTNQNAAFVIKTPSFSEKPIKIKSDRIVGIVRDGLWSNTEAEFVLEDNWITIHNYKKQQLLKPSDFKNFVNYNNYSQYFNYLKEQKVELNDGFSFNTKRLRTSYILDKYLVLSANKENAGRAYIEYNFNKRIKEMDINLSLWSKKELLYKYDSKIFIEKKNSWGDWEFVCNIEIDDLPKDKDSSKLYSLKDLNSKDIRITVEKKNPSGTRNKGRLVIGDTVIKH